jgi:hypothetical protein
MLGIVDKWNDLVFDNSLMKTLYAGAILRDILAPTLVATAKA